MVDLILLAKTRGFILLLSLIMMATLSAMTGALIVSLSTDYRNAVVVSNNSKAFWAAEAGIADAIKRLKNNEIVLADGACDNATVQTISFGGGTYSVSLCRTARDIKLISTGVVNSQSRIVEQIEVTGFPSAFNHAVF